ncbi:hypothetical protein N7539_003512 [Penicillium diatomitis]|uniref:Uncharacterized protein n=1 Tax=Penicillium diatomitis TaxID=2819901 RepID=A0A9X0BXX4_9EURO|nr:uncharacterized protein N7539_003512 [Penicillium diatomitis]KAJ5488622.1 hypothetical protein N7539_003512 [Penicillium diatomitis]
MVVDKTISDYLKSTNLEAQRLFILYYAGHGFVNDGNFCLGDQATFFSWNMIDYRLLTTQGHHDTEKVDVLAVVDCGYGGQIPRTWGSQSIQILAASAEVSNVRTKNQISFTRLLHRSAHALAQNPSSLANQRAISVITIFDHISKSF